MEIFLKILLQKYRVNLITLAQDEHSEKKSDGLCIYRLRHNNLEKKNFFKRAYDEIAISRKLVKKANTLPADATILTTPTMFLIPAGTFLKTKKIVDIRDVVWEYLADGPIKNALKKIMLFSLHRYDNIIVTNDYEYRYLKNFEPKIIYNGISEERFQLLSHLQLAPHDRFTMTYIGNVGIAQDLTSLCSLAQKFPDIDIKIIGDGAEFEKLKNYVQSKKLDNVKLLGKLPWERVLEEYRTSSLLFAKLNEKFKMAMPSKLYEYAATGLPILYVGEGQAYDFVRGLKECHAVKNREEEKAEIYIRKLIQSGLHRTPKKIHENIELIQKKFIREKNAKALLEFV